MERSTIFIGKTHYFDWAIFKSHVKLPEGISHDNPTTWWFTPLSKWFITPSVCVYTVYLKAALHLSYLYTYIYIYMYNYERQIHIPLHRIVSTIFAHHIPIISPLFIVTVYQLYAQVSHLAMGQPL